MARGDAPPRDLGVEEEHIDGICLVDPSVMRVTQGDHPSDRSIDASSLGGHTLMLGTHRSAGHRHSLASLTDFCRQVFQCCADLCERVANFSCCCSKTAFRDALERRLQLVERRLHLIDAGLQI